MTETFVPVIAECAECGSLVSNVEAHENFHKKISLISVNANLAVALAPIR